MATTSPSATEGAQRRRLVLIDFDWADADLLPDLLRQPEVSVRLVAGERSDDAGLRVAELCGLPRTVDLADLTREIFDLALVGERSARRTQVEGLLQALGTPCASPRTFMDGRMDEVAVGPDVQAPLALHAAALEDALGGDEFDAIMERTLPDVGDDPQVTPQPVQPTAQPAATVESLENFPSPDDRHQLELALRGMMSTTGAERAELHAGDRAGMELIAHAGPNDSLLHGLVELALQSNSPQVVSRLTGPEEGKAWGAWPFRTTQRRGVVAAAAIDPGSGWTVWKRMVDDLKSTWDLEDREKVAPAFPMVPEPGHGWLTAEEFRGRLELAVERNSRDGLRFAVHRLGFADVPAPVNVLCERLPEQLRDTDCICHPTPRTVLLLTAGPASGFPHLRRRILALWEQAWHDGQQQPPAPPITDERVEMTSAEDGPAFVSSAEAWLSDA